jgi:hypothetical protein
LYVVGCSAAGSCEFVKRRASTASSRAFARSQCVGSVVTVVGEREGRMRPGEEGTKAASCQDSHASPLPHLHPSASL